MLAFFNKIQYDHRPASWICWGKPWDHPRRPIHGGYPVQKFHHDRHSSVRVIIVVELSSFTLESYFWDQNVSFFLGGGLLT